MTIGVASFQTSFTLMVRYYNHSFSASWDWQQPWAVTPMELELKYSLAMHL